MYARGMSQRDIAGTLEEIYGCRVSHETVSRIAERAMEDVVKWQNRPLKPVYAFLFVDCIYASVRSGHGEKAREQAVYVMLGIDLDGHKEILALSVNPAESRAHLMNIFDSLRQRGVQDILCVSMDGVSGLEDGVKAIFPKTVVQRCIVHLMRGSLKYVATKDYGAFPKTSKPTQ
jgi:transposase-like protein